MHARAVITLAVVLADQLPVGRDLVFDAPAQAQVLHLEAGKIRQVSEVMLQRLGRIVEVEEDEPRPGCQPHRRQRKTLALEALLHARHLSQAAVEAIGPCVIRADHSAQALAALGVQQSRTAMSADVVERAHHAVAAACNDDRIAGDLVREVVARRRDLFLAADADPHSGEQALVLEPQDLGRGIECRRKSACIRQRTQRGCEVGERETGLDRCPRGGRPACGGFLER